MISHRNIKMDITSNHTYEYRNILRDYPNERGYVNLPKKLIYKKRKKYKKNKPL